MPAILIESNVLFSHPYDLASALSKAVALSLNHPERHVTVSLRKSMYMLRAGKSTEFAFVEIRAIGGFTVNTNNTLCCVIAEILEKHGVNPKNIDINFIDIAPENWGKAEGVFK